MGRKKIEIERIKDDRIRRVTFKKRRIGLLKKAIQLSKLTNAKIMLKVYHEEDGSLVEYFSHDEHMFDKLSASDAVEYSKFTNRHYDLLSRVEERVNKNGFSNDLINELYDQGLGEKLDQK